MGRRSHGINGKYRAKGSKVWFRIHEEAIEAMMAVEDMTPIQKHLLLDFIKKYGPEEILDRQEDLADDFGVNREYLCLMLRKARKHGFIEKMGNCHYRISPFFWWIPERGVNARAAIKRYPLYMKAFMDKNVNVLKFHYGGQNVQGEETITSQEEHP